MLAAGFVMLVTLEFTSLDRWLASPFFDTQARDFPLRTTWFTTTVSHEGLKWLSGAAFGWLVLGLRWPLGVLRRLDARRRAYLVGSATLCLTLIPIAKRFSFTHCPWDLAIFGGGADYLRLFDWPPSGARRGHCFPAGHATAAFAYLAGWFVWRDVNRSIARRWLIAVLAFGGWAGLAQQVRGAHFLSHTLWTAWVCYAVAIVLAWWLSRVR